MSHIALYRAWRPQTFKDVVGQRHITQTLQNSLKDARFTHAYLFSGPRGTGKTSAAKILSKALNCEQGPSVEPCNTCHACVGITEGAIMDVVEIDAASNRGVEEIRDVRDKVKYAPTEVRYKVYIIDEVHMLTTEAFNALLKTLEEPPAHVVFILATTEPGRIPATILSRCQRFDFRRIALEDQLYRLEHICREEQIEAEPKALELLARLSDGGMRDALSMLDQVFSFSGERLTYESVVAAMGGIANEQFAALASALRDQDIAKVLGLIEDFMSEGKSVDKCMESLIQYYRDLLLVKMVPGAHEMTDRILDPSHFSELAKDYPHEALFRIIDILNKYHVEMKYATQPQILFEIAMMKICTSMGATPPAASVASETPSAEWTGKIVRLEQQVQELANQLRAVSAGGGSGAASSRAPRSQSMAPARSSLASSGAAASSAPATSGGAPMKAVKREVFLNERGSGALKDVLMKWSRVLQQVKDTKITVHAWLVDGEPVSVADGAILVAFKNTIHRETTEKPANRQLIEQVLQEVMGQPYGLQTIMVKEWKDLEATAGDAPDESGGETLELVPEDEQGGKGYKEEWINEAIEMFGEDMVTIKEES